MKRATAEWIKRAEGDWKVAQREGRAADPVWNVVCFLGQQCCEKYLKAFLEEDDIPFGKTHDLVVLLNLTGGKLPELEALRSQLGYLSPFGTVARYPGADADQGIGQEVIRLAGEVRRVLRETLELPTETEL